LAATIVLDASSAVPPRVGEVVALKVRVSDGRNVVLEDIGEQGRLLRGFPPIAWMLTCDV
jgi:hypothetical protein